MEGPRGEVDDGRVPASVLAEGDLEGEMVADLGLGGNGSLSVVSEAVGIVEIGVSAVDA